MKPLVIWGASGHARVVADIVRLRGEYQIVGWLDDAAAARYGEEWNGAPILGGGALLNDLREQGIEHLIVAVGDCAKRLELAARAKTHGFELIRAVHPNAIIAGDAELGAGTLIAAGAVVNPAARVGEHGIINTGATVDHNAVIEAGAHIGPGAHLGGYVRVGRGAWIGIGAIVGDRVTIGDFSIVGAGAVVVRDIPARVVAYGVPARVMREL